MERYRLSNVMLPEEMDAMADGQTAGHRAAKAAIKAHRPELPVGLSLAIVDDVLVGDDASVRDRKRAEVYQRWLDLVRDDDFVGVQNYERVYYDGSGAVPPPPEVQRNQMGSGIEPASLAGAVRYAYRQTGVPVLVTEHGMSTDDDTLRAAFLEPSLAGLLDVIEEGVPVLGYCHWTLMDNFEWIFGYGHQLGLHEVDRDSFVRTAKPSAAVYAAIATANAVSTSRGLPSPRPRPPPPPHPPTTPTTTHPTTTPRNPPPTPRRGGAPFDQNQRHRGGGCSRSTRPSCAPTSTPREPGSAPGPQGARSSPP